LRKYAILVIFLILSVTTIALEECKEIIEPIDIPCTMTSLWNYTPPCNSYNVMFYNETGINIINYTSSDFGNTSRCQIIWNISTTGTYTGDVGNGDTINVIVEDEDLMLSLIIGIGIVAAILLFIAFKLEESHFLLKLLFIISAVTLLLLIPVSTFMPDNIGETFYKVFLYIFIAFWLYIGGYFVWYVFQMFKFRRTSD